MAESKSPPKKKKPARNPKTGRITKGVAQDTNKNGTAGAPTKYDPSICEQMLEFFSGDHNHKEVIMEKVTPTKYGEATEKRYQIVPNDLPFFEAFARKIGVSYQTLRNWATEKEGDEKDAPLKHPEFFDAYNLCKQIQKEFLIHNGLAGAYPPASFIFVAKNITDMTDSQELKLKKAAAEDTLDDEQLNELIFGEKKSD